MIGGPGAVQPVQPVERDSRGILDPHLLRSRVRLNRYPPGPELAAVVDRFWAVTWDLPDGLVHCQQVLTHPGANVSVGTPDARGGGDAPEARLNGVAVQLSTRALAGRGWTVAAMLRPGGLGAFVAGSAADLTGRVVALGEAAALDEPGLVRGIDAEPDEAGRVELLSRALQQAVRPDRLGAAARVATVAGWAETDRALRRLRDLAERAQVAPRTLQRAFLHNAGVSPTWVLRRYRLLDAAEAVRSGTPVSWAGLAVELGYADQAHLTRDFRTVLGQTPAAYANAQLTPSGDRT